MSSIQIILSSSSVPEEILKSGFDLVRAFFPDAVPGINIRLPENKLHSGQNRRNLIPGQYDHNKNDSGQTGKAEGELRAEVQVDVPLGVRAPWELKGPLEFTWTLPALPAETANSQVSYFLPGYLPAYRQVNLSEQEIVSILAQTAGTKENRLKLLFKHGLLKLFSQVCRRRLPWGILSGIRPGKIVQNLYDRGLSRAERTAVLEKYYALRPDKAELLQKIAAVQRPLLEELRSDPRRIALYISIPFCPSRCSYCSFPADRLSKDRQELTVYLQALQAEIQAAGLLISKLGLVVGSVYIGGGTPTILTTEELFGLMRELKREVPWQECREFTVEAGRADTLSPGKLAVLGEQGVTRLSINPQTMQEATLRRIGRDHSVADVGRVYNIARSLASWIINMDLILGLPGESLADVRDTLEQLTGLQPDNLTVHMLALKKGSREYELGLRHREAALVEQMQELSRQAAASWGLEPYYLYRQKRLAGNLENIGYARPGLECLYNIAMIEERQHILGLGAGASSKIIDLAGGRLVNIHHAQSWQHYRHKWPDIHRQRTEALAVSLG
ncbi:MAG TPA: coproporphyrinogen dehydrogenase HemZ [Desulfitobacteriaceae bacterium]|nr:coproporphyrinogen dehydrogenase HemZ [Desulfitobacteriaceae bacterium]